MGDEKCDNPWAVTSIDSFNFLCCPECAFRSKENSSFESHAVQNHPKSKAFFGNCAVTVQTKTEESITDLLYCCSQCTYKTEDSNLFQIHSQRHLISQLPESDALSDPLDSFEIKTEDSEDFDIHFESKPQFSEDLDVQEAKYTNYVELTTDPIKDSKKLLSISETCNAIPEETKTKESISIEKCGPKRSKASHFQCSICPEVFKLRKDLNLHMSKTHESKCTFCSKEFDKIKDLWRHENTDHKNVSCDECNKTFKSPKFLRLHKKMHVLRACEFCGKMIVENHMASHINVMHGAVDKSALTFICEICPFKTTQKRYLNEHKRTRHGPDKVGEKIENYTCQICSEIFPYSKFAERSYIQHYRSVHDTECPEYEDKEKFLCEQCPAIFFNKQSLKHHILKSHVNGSKISKQTTCEKCKITFSGRRSYAAHCKKFHDKIVSSFKLVKCNSCDEEFKAPNLYIQHHQKNHGSLPPEYVGKNLFDCDHCQFTAISQTSLSAHMVNVHKQGDKSWIKDKNCPHCEKVFKHRVNLKEHILSKHENKKDHHCDQCQKSFGTLSTLKTHKLNVHNRVQCEECGKENYNSFALKRHKALVHGIKPKDVFQCDDCPLFFSGLSALNKHVASKHP